MAATICGKNYRATVSRFADTWRVEYQYNDEIVGSFRWCDSTDEVCELLEELATR